MIVLYNSQNVVKECLSKYTRNQKIIAVDNGSGDESVKFVSQMHPQAKIIINKTNRGFGAAANQALEFVDTPYILLLNPDAIMDHNAIEKLLEQAENDPNTGIFAPYLTIPGRGLELDLKGPKGISYDKPITIPEGNFSTWFATGAVWLVRTSDWRTIGGFDEKIFLYGEDLDFCIRLQEHGRSIMICPDSKGKHFRSQSVPTNKINQWRKEWNIVWSHLYITRKHVGKLKVRVEILRLLVKHFPKMLFYALVFESKRFRRDAAVVHAIISYILGYTPDKS